MAQYDVLRPIEYNGKLYVPTSDDAPAVTKSAGNGGNIPVDRSGTIDLPDGAASQFALGQIALVKAKTSKGPATTETKK